MPTHHRLKNVGCVGLNWIPGQARKDNKIKKAAIAGRPQSGALNQPKNTQRAISPKTVSGYLTRSRRRIKCASTVAVITAITNTNSDGVYGTCIVNAFLMTLLPCVARRL